LSLVLFKLPIRPKLSLGTFVGNVNLDFQQTDKDRMRELLVKAKEGTLTANEEVEMDNYERVGHMLSLMKSKARRSLKGGKVL